MPAAFHLIYTQINGLSPIIIIFEILTWHLISFLMTFGVCPLSVVPIRSSASDKSEMVSQLLFGELFEVLETKGRKWWKIRCENDNYVGWVVSHQVKPVTPTEFDGYQNRFAYNLELMQAVMAKDHFLPITLGARLPNFDGMRFYLGEAIYTFSGQAVFPADIEINSDFIIKLARRYLQAPYLWGGRSPFGIDSSGLIQVVFQMAGIPMPREPQQQLETGTAVDFIEQTLPGDLAFFENRKGRIAHVGLILPEGGLLHVHGKVRIDKLDHYGAYNEEDGRYTHRLRLVKRILPPIPQQNKTTGTEETSISRQAELF